MAHICCNQGVFKELYFAKFRILQLSLESWFSVYVQNWATLQLLLISCAIMAIAKLHKKNQFWLSSEKFLICEISHFTTFPRILVFNHHKRILTTLQLLRILHSIITILKLYKSLQLGLSSIKFIIVFIIVSYSKIYNSILFIQYLDSILEEKWGKDFRGETP